MTHDPSNPPWLPEAVGLLGADPVSPPALATALAGNHPAVTADDLDARLSDHPRAFRVGTGWVDLVAAADGVVLTHLLTDEERDHGVLAADEDLDLWAALAAGGLPLATGGEVRLRTFPDSGTSAETELVGPEGWLAGFEPEQLVAVRLRAGALELAAIEEPEPDDDALTPILQYLLQGAIVGFEAYLERRAEDPDDEEAELGPATPTGWLVANLVTNRRLALREPLPPLSELVPLTELELCATHVCLPGIPHDRFEAAEHGDDELRARMRAALLLFGATSDDTGDQDAALLDEIAEQDIVDVVADRAEMDGVSEPALAGLRQAADGVPRRTAMVHLFAARAAAHDDRPAEAERLVAEALRHDPELAPALLDASEYAAIRGDAVAADGFLQRAGLPRSDPRRQALAPVLAPPQGGPGRNRPCPCGSGRKHKLCCLPTAPRALPVRAPLLYAKVAWWMERAPRRDQVTALASLAEANHPAPELLALDLAIFDIGLIESFLATSGDLLPADERELLTRWQEAPIAPYEVTDVRPGNGVTLRPLVGGTPVELPDRALSTSVRRLDLLVARILPDGERPRLLAVPSYVPRTRRTALREVFEDYSPYRLASFFGPQPPPRITNRDGHKLVFSEATYEVPDGDEAWRRLAAGLQPDPEDPHQLALTRDLEAETVHAGTVRRSGDHWQLTANSLERLRELQELVGTAAPDARLVEESSEPAATALASRTPPGTADGVGRAGPTGPAPHGPAVEAALAAHIREYEQRWLDEPVPALAGATPRQAAAGNGDQVDELLALLDDLEWRGEELMSAHRLRAALGLEG